MEVGNRVKKKKSGIIIFIVVSLIILLGLSVYIAYRNTHCSLYEVEAVETYDGSVYGISREQDGDYFLFDIDIESGRTDSCRMPVPIGQLSDIRIVYNRCYIPLTYTIGNEGQVTVLRYKPENGRFENFYSGKAYGELNLVSEGYYNDAHCVVLYFGENDDQKSSGKQTMIYLDESGNEIFRNAGYRLDRDFYCLEAISGNRLAWIGINGDVVTSDYSGNRTVCYEAQADGKIHRFTAYSIYPDRAEFYDIDTNEMVRVALDGSGTVIREPLDKYEVESDEIVYVAEKTGGCIALLTGDGYGSYRLITKDKQGRTVQFDEIDASPSHLILLSVQYFLALALAFAVLSTAVYLIYKKNNKIIPSVVIIFIILLLISATGSYILSERVKYMVADSNDKENLARMERIADSIESTIDRDKYEKSDFSDNFEYIYDLSHRTDRIFNGEAALDSDINFIARDTYNIRVLTQFFKYHNGEFFSADGTDISIRPVSVGTMIFPHHVLMEAAETGSKLQYEGFSILKGAFNSIVCPVLSEDGTIAGAFAVMIYDDYMTQINMNNQINMIIVDVLLMILVIVICIVLAVAVNPVVKMAGNLERLTEADDSDEHVRVMGCDEVQELTRVYNRLIDNVRDYLHKTGNVRRMNSAFVPNELVSLMGKQSIADIESGDSRKLFSVIYTAVHYGEIGNQGINTQNNLFDRLRKSVGSILESVNKHGGITLQVDEQIVTALFSEDYSSAIETAVEACIRNHKPDMEEKCRGTGFVSALSASDAVITADGIDSHMEFVLDAASSSANQAIARQAVILHIPVIAADTVIKGLGSDVINHHIRYVGQIEHEGQKIRLYEIFEWESEEQIEKKELTRDEFESGIRAMEFGKFDIAQNHFSNVLKTNSLDSPAGVYFRQCDALRNERRG